MTRKVCLVALIVGITATAACHPPRPERPLSPRYPSMLLSAGLPGSTAFTVRVDSRGKAWIVRPDTVKARRLHELSWQSIGQAVKDVSWRPARRIGVRRADAITYRVDFVLVRNTLPLGPNERRAAGNDTLPDACPMPRSAHHIVVCRPVEHIDYRVVY